MRAIVRFHYGRTIYEIGDVVPEEIIKKYPQLVGLVYEESRFEKEKKNYDEAPAKAEGPILTTKKVKK